MRPLRVCLIMSADLWAGAEVQVATAASYLVEQPDVKLTAVLFNDGWLERELRRLGVETAVVDERRHNPSQIVAFLTRFLARTRIDLVHTHRVQGQRARIDGREAGRRAACHPDGARPDRADARMGARALCVYEAARQGAAVDASPIASSPFRAATARGARAGRLQARARDDDSQRHRSRPRQSGMRAGRRPARARHRPSALLIGTAGRLVPVKGHEYLHSRGGRHRRERPDVAS